ncbi:hypothetical protein [Micromonospora avicenniae]|uniref:hypothetical protein n=1 Tax=Micromonospora avicenniae TaxID=1198245 RepID=UPI00331BB5C1
MLIPSGADLVLWAVLDALPAGRTFWSALHSHIPKWLDIPFLAAVVAGLLTQLAFSLMASSESRRLNAKTAARLEEIKGNLIEMATTQLTVRQALTELTARVLSDSAPGAGSASPRPASPPGSRPVPDSERPEHEFGGDLRQVLDKLVDEAGGTLVLRAAYERLGAAVSLQNLLYAVYWLRDVGRITWEDPVIGWETELRRAASDPPAGSPPRQRHSTENGPAQLAAGSRPRSER